MSKIQLSRSAWAYTDSVLFFMSWMEIRILVEMDKQAMKSELEITIFGQPFFDYF